MLKELPQSNTQYEKLMWEPVTTAAGVTRDIFAGVRIKTREGEQFELSRFLSQAELELACKNGVGWDVVIEKLAFEALAELEASRAGTSEFEIAPEVGNVPDGELLTDLTLPDPAPEDVDWVLKGLEPPAAGLPEGLKNE